jgi:hypothetical protein
MKYIKKQDLIFISKQVHKLRSYGKKYKEILNLINAVNPEECEIKTVGVHLFIYIIYS